MADPIYGQVTITYNGPGDVKLDPPVGILRRDVQTMNWILVDTSGLNATFKVDANGEGGIVFPVPPPPPPPHYSRWSPPGSVPKGNATQYSADVHDQVAHGMPPKKYSYDIVIERDPTAAERAEGGGEIARLEEMLHAADFVTKHKQQSQAQSDNDREPEIVDPPVENQPQP